MAVYCRIAKADGSAMASLVKLDEEMREFFELPQDPKEFIPNFYSVQFDIALKERKFADQIEYYKNEIKETLENGGPTLMKDLINTPEKQQEWADYLEHNILILEWLIENGYENAAWVEIM